eukprot:12793165-Alexandrium_andersonii.AAC.1
MASPPEMARVTSSTSVDCPASSGGRLGGAPPAGGAGAKGAAVAAAATGLAPGAEAGGGPVGTARPRPSAGPPSRSAAGTWP